MTVRDTAIALLVILLVLGLWLAPGDSPPPAEPVEASPDASVAASPLTTGPDIKGDVGTWWEREKEKNRKAQQRR